MFKSTHTIAKILLICLLTLPFNSIHSAPKKPALVSATDSSSCLKISGRVTLDKKLIKGKYKVELMRYNTVIDSAIVKDNRSFTFVLNKNSSYLIKLSKKGHMTRYISVCTNMNDAQKQNEIHTLFFEAELLGVKEALSLDHEALELPIAIISFNKNTKKFSHNKGYTAFVKQKIYSGS